MSKVESFEQVGVLDETVEPQNQKTMNYGNIHFLINNKFISISVGPDYLFTIVAAFFLSATLYSVYKLTNYHTIYFLEKFIGYFLISLSSLSFVTTVLRDPGIYNCYQNFEPKGKYCEDCRVFKPVKVFHCKICNTCIEGHDHHCPWMSKCIGRKNIKWFYVFIGSVPTCLIYMGYLVFSIMRRQNNS